MSQLLTTQRIAKLARVHRDTLLRWLRGGKIPEPSRDRNGWRVFNIEQAKHIVHYAKGNRDLSSQIGETNPTYQTSPLAKLRKLNWDFADANTGYLTHSLHPYPAKFIPQIPNALIQELSSVGDTILDPFCGSGTSLVEALLLKRHAIGIDANPLAGLIARAKTTPVSDGELEELMQFEAEAANLAEQRSNGTLNLFPETRAPHGKLLPPIFEGIDFWFDRQVIEELTLLKAMCLGLKFTVARDLALTALSSIIVAVSRQDSDTRYVRREKNLEPGDTATRFARALSYTIARSREFSELADKHFTCKVINANILALPNIGKVDLVVCSPPYPNAYSYHLYHRTRMLWLDMDQAWFKDIEIGSHRKYSRKGSTAANVNTFREELRKILSWMRGVLCKDGYACFVIGDSILKAEVTHNDQVLIKVASELGYKLEANFTRQLQDAKKSFNPVIGKIKREHIVILRHRGR